MELTPLPLAGAFRITVTRRGDPRGWFARLWAEEVFADAGLPVRWPHVNMSHTAQSGTVRGLHFQRPPRAEGKIVRCIRGAAFDAIADLRAGSDTYGQWHGEEISAENGIALYLPPGFAHGYQTRAPETELLYMHTEPYAPELEGGVSVADPAIAIRWPLPIAGLSDRDAALPPLRDVEPIRL